MSHASEPSMAAFWAVVSIAVFGGLAFIWALGGLWLETYREEVADGRR